MDIDLLFYGNLCLETENLVIPHPFIARRRFVLEPLNEVMPEFIHPKEKIEIRQLLANCKDASKVSTFKKSPELPG